MQRTAGARQELFIEFARLSLFSLFAIALAAENILHFERAQTAWLVVIIGMLWIALLVDYLRQLRSAADRRSFIRQNLGYPVYLATVVFATSHNIWVIAIPLIGGFVLQLRRLSVGNAVTFAFVLSGFTAVLATAGILYAERNEPNSPITDWGSAATWTVARLLQLRGFEPGNPTSPDGIALSFVVAMIALVVGALLTAQIVHWVIGADRSNGDH